MKQNAFVEFRRNSSRIFRAPHSSTASLAFVREAQAGRMALVALSSCLGLARLEQHNICKHVYRNIMLHGLQVS